jgi:hypothetical protein
MGHCVSSFGTQCLAQDVLVMMMILASFLGRFVSADSFCLMSAAVAEVVRRLPLLAAVQCFIEMGV